MNKANLRKGKAFKNYKDLCNKLGLEVKFGNSKISQLKELERFCKYHKDGRQFIIDKVYAKPKTKVDGRSNNGGNNNSIYADELDKLVLAYVKTGTYTLQELFTKQIPILTKKHSELLKVGYKRFAKDNKLSKGLVKEYNENIYSILKNAIQTSLGRLQKQGKLKFKKCIQATTPKGKKFILTSQQTKKLKLIESKTYADMDITPYQRINNKTINKKFKANVCSRMDIEMKNYCTVYDITMATDDNDLMLDADIKSLTSSLIVSLHRSIIKVEIDNKKPYRTNENLEKMKILDNNLFNNATEDLTNFCFGCSYIKGLFENGTVQIPQTITSVDDMFHKRDLADGIPF